MQRDCRMLPMILVTESTKESLNLIEKTRKTAWLGFIDWMNIQHWMNIGHWMNWMNIGHWMTTMVSGARIIQEESQK